MSKITWELQSEDIAEILTANKKTFSYIKVKLSRFYLQVNSEGLDLYFKDNAGIMKYHMDVTFINKPSSSKLFAVDFQKFVNALLRFQVEGALFNLTDSLISITDINNKATVVKLSATPGDDDLDSILADKETNKGTMILYKHTEDLNNIFTLTSKLMNNGNPNNCLAIVDGNVATYADRSLIYKEECETTFKGDIVSIHSFLVGFVMNTYQDVEIDYYFDFKNHALYFKAGKVQAYLLSEKPDISIPSDSDLEGIRPTEKDTDANVYKMSAIELASSLNFFEGFFEKDVWKPITFSLKKDDYKLSYESPVTEVAKEIEGLFTIKTESDFTLMSTPIQTVLTNILKEDKDVEVVMLEKPDMPGVSFKVAEHGFELILAKLNY